MSSELQDVQNAFDRLRRVGRTLSVLFALALVLCLFSLLSPVFVWILGRTGMSNWHLDVSLMWPTLLFNALQFTVYLIVFAFCFSLARHTSRGYTPFTPKLIRRMRFGTLLLLVYFIICLAWNPLFSVIDPLETYWYQVSGTYQTFVAPHINYPALIIALVLYLMSHILQYGEVLQEVSDGTV